MAIDKDWALGAVSRAFSQSVRLGDVKKITLAHATQFGVGMQMGSVGTGVTADKLKRVGATPDDFAQWLLDNGARDGRKKEA
jgi:hypothetical protein